MTLSIKRRITLHTPEAKEIELYWGASTVRNKTRQATPETDAFLNTLEDYVNGAIIQYHRIRGDWDLGQRCLRESYPASFDVASLERQTRSLEPYFALHQPLTFLDFHFYLICIDKVRRLYPRVLHRMAPLATGANNRQEIKRKRQEADKLQQGLEDIRDARHYFEHIEERIATGNFDGLALERDENSGRFYFAKGDDRLTVDIDKWQRVITAAYEALIDYIRALPVVE